ncbi:hypothetical protein [Acidovorax sp.]|uniref:hypothetical protein n=1 Tax=Acidovorax sp. TaxID=1872122 RepID=UPI002ACED6EE|nr:hypothetical protein [Acidovorax sp.]MDZ7863200.1 hypothetical protein [Acidovorax sp.]
MPVAQSHPACVREFRQVLLWPLRLMPVRGSEGQHAKPWQLLADMGEAASPWREVVDEFTGDSSRFHERHYNEFVTFLPYVQRFLYGEGRSREGSRATGSPMRVFRRSDVSAVRAVLRPGDAPITLDIVHVDLYFFLDLDLVLLNVEVSARDLQLAQAQELLYRFGRGYPAGWDAEGHAQHCLYSAEWLGAAGQVLAASDANQRDLFMAHVSSHRAPRISAHWAWLLEPLVSDHSERSGPLRYRQIEYYRMPQLAFLALDDPRALSRSDFIRFGLVTGAAPPSDDDTCLPYSEEHLADFEKRFCYDRFWSSSGAAPNTRYLCSGHSLLVLGNASSPFYVCRDRGVLAQFRHQHFLLFLIAHFQKAALLMFSDRLAEALKDLDIADAASVRRFKRTIRDSFAGFLRFTHRYWFHEVSEQAQVRALFRMCANHLGLDPLYTEVKERIGEMNQYLDADSLRRQANTVVRLTVVTIFGLIGTVTTGFLGMNLLAEADAPLGRKLGIFALVFVLTTALTIYTMVKSKRLSDFLDVLSDERATAWQKFKALGLVWRRAGG